MFNQTFLINRLKDKYSTGRREGPVTQQRLDTALRNATELESQNVVLTTRVAELEANVRRMSSRFRDLAALLNLPGTAEEKVVEEQVIRKVELLSAVEKEVSDARNERHNDVFVQQNLHKEISNLRKQIENQEVRRTSISMKNSVIGKIIMFFLASYYTSGRL